MVADKNNSGVLLVDKNFSGGFLHPYYQNVFSRCSETCQKIVDFGCTKTQFLETIRENRNEMKKLKTLIGIDKSEMDINQKIFSFVPNENDYKNLRNSSLDVAFYVANSNEFNQFNFFNPDLFAGTNAVVAFNFIQTLKEKEIPYFINFVLDHIQPEWFFLSTPDRRCNPYLPLINDKHPGKGKNNIKRDIDNIFEVDKETFQDFCDEVLERYPQYVLDEGHVLEVGYFWSLNFDGFVNSLAVFRLTTKVIRCPSTFVDIPGSSQSLSTYILRQEFMYRSSEFQIICQKVAEIVEEMFNLKLPSLAVKCDKIQTGTSNEEIGCWLELDKVVKFDNGFKESALAKLVTNKFDVLGSLLRVGWRLNFKEGKVWFRFKDSI